MPDFQFKAPVTDHPNFINAQAAWDAIGRGDVDLDGFTDDMVVDNGPGAGPWRHLEGKEAFFTMFMKFVPYFQGTWRQEGRVIYADDTTVVSLVHETGTAPSGDVFDNRAVYVSRLDSEGRTNRIWTTDVDHEAMEEFWKRNRIDPD